MLSKYLSLVRTAEKTQVFIKGASYVMLFRKIIFINLENNMKPINTHCGQNTELLNLWEYGPVRYHRVLNVKIAGF